MPHSKIEKMHSCKQIRENGICNYYGHGGVISIRTSGTELLSWFCPTFEQMIRNLIISAVLYELGAGQPVVFSVNIFVDVAHVTFCN